MDPATMINNNEASAVNHHHRHSAAVAASYNLSDIWEQFPLTVNGGGVEESGPVLSSRRGHFVSNLGGFVENRDILVDEGMIAKQKNRDLVAIKRRDVVVVEDESTNHLSPNSSNEMNDNNKRLKALGDENIDPKATEMDANSVAGNKPADQPSEPPKQGYIHVRARRGQATDSHSLAERARREKIGERMKILQDLVPGCNKVIGKAMVLDEIINYIQSLQRQVEFLSMKLEAVSSRMTPGIDCFPPKDFGAPIYEAAGMTFGAQAPKEYSSGSPPEWLHMQVGGSFERPT